MKMVWVQGPMLVRDGANAMMTPERIQSVTISYDQRTLSKAVSDDPARNDILRLDEMMSRKPDWIDTYRLAIYFISIHYRYLLQITGVTLTRSHAILNWFVVLLHVLQSAASRVVRYGSVQSSCLSCAPRGVFEYFVSLYIIIIELYHNNQIHIAQF